MRPILVHMGPVPISSFGLFLLLAFLVGIAVARRRGRALGIEPPQMLDISLYMIMAGILATFLEYGVVDFQTLVADWKTFFKNWQAFGFTLYGAIVGGLVIAAVYARARGIPLRKFLDVFAPALALAHATGMVGALLGGQLRGRATGVPWAVQMILDLEQRHPTQMYLLIASLGIYLVLRAQERQTLAPGSLFFLWLLLHALARVAVEFFMESPPVLGPLTLGQLANIAAAVVAIIGLIVAARRPVAEPAAQPATTQNAG